MPGTQCPLPVLCPQVSFISCASSGSSMFSPFSSPTSEFQLMSCELDVPYMFVLCSQDLLLTLAAEAWGGHTPNREGWYLLIFGETFLINSFTKVSGTMYHIPIMLLRSLFSQMERVLLSTELPFASDFVSHLNKITHDDHCKYGNSSISMEI